MKLIFAISVLALTLYPAKKKVVLLDSWFNNETTVDSSGKKHSWHYKWEEQDNNGFSLFAKAFTSHGVDTQTSYEKPTKAILDKADIYIIVDPDVPKENPSPNYIEANDAETIYNWVKDGGVLLLMGNDLGNAEFDHLNGLSEKFGIRFNKDSRNNVQGDHFETGALMIPASNSILKNARKIYMKDICTLHVTAPAKPTLVDKGDVIIATAKIGKGSVLAVGDPWLYNEYTDGKKLPSSYQNYTAAKDLVNWLVNQIPKNK